jgi:hypothetical protein
MNTAARLAARLPFFFAPAPPHDRKQSEFIQK